MIFTGHEEIGHGTGVLESLALLHGEDQENLFFKAGENVSGRLICIPGLPAMHEWELNPQYLPFIPPYMTFISPRLNNMIKHVNTLVFCTTSEMEPVSTSSLRNAFKNPITPFFIGPAVDLIPPHQLDPDSPVTQFLDRAYAEKGAHSVIYVAFGTTFFPLPSSISHLMAVVDEITKAGFRFIFALSSASAKVEKSWMDGYVKSGHAIFPEWTPDSNSRTPFHYFLTHGGWNSSTEALVRGVPMIFWPFIGDQPTNAMQIANVHDCGFELLQVRTGPARSTAYRNGTEVEITGTEDAVRVEIKQILELSKGPRGEHQRINTRILGKIVCDSLGPGGSGDAVLEKLGSALDLS
ncbi:unnamed protein product [Rhizoctonia solani]|uniref:Uncharacterized protein n=1 Tax=Rhizoctonia solani TaxID=456999 RepID=A0A8H2XWU1_9AGAM|nr:unnamed protein product [Rhizoctonia solani]